MSDANNLTSPECPVRQFMSNPDIVWRHGKPDYSLVDKKYLREKRQNWPLESTEKLVENLVKTWEMESSHKVREQDWGSVDHDKFEINVNDTLKFDLRDNILNGNYNMMLRNCVLYDPTIGNKESHELFRNCFKSGFAFELSKLYTGPPRVMFSWRHWGEFEGPYGDYEPTGETVELTGFCIVEVNEELKIEKLDVWFDPHPMMAALKSIKGPCGPSCPLAKR